MNTGSTGSTGACNCDQTPWIIIGCGEPKRLPPGPTGPSGSVGATGMSFTGPQGLPGATGSSGDRGPTGSAGMRGIIGPTGPQGVQGIQGVDGDVGPTGPGGVNGTNGAPGATGAQGISGATGPQGATGVAGAVGPTGASGSVGATGAAGAPGPTGPQGASGVAGATGAQGGVGPTGPDAAPAESASLYAYNNQIQSGIGPSGQLVSGDLIAFPLAVTLDGFTTPDSGFTWVPNQGGRYLITFSVPITVGGATTNSAKVMFQLYRNGSSVTGAGVVADADDSNTISLSKTLILDGVSGGDQFQVRYVLVVPAGQSGPSIAHTFAFNGQFNAVGPSIAFNRIVPPPP
jgi:hypothetical protein